MNKLRIAAMSVRTRKIRRDAGKPFAPGKLHTKALSNTGHVGISDTTHWVRSRSYHCFQVSWPAGNGKTGTTRIHYGPNRRRDSALKMAIAVRKEKTC